MSQPRPFSEIRSIQAEWRRRPIAERLGPIRRLRGLIAAEADRLIAALEPRQGRIAGESVTLEILPLADAARFLAREAAVVLAPQRLGRRGRPGWLFGVDAEIRREPLGLILILAPGNYPLFLPGVQMIQALVAGNAVLVKPAPGNGTCVAVLAEMLERCGVPAGLCTILDETVEAAQQAIADGVDKVVLTGSATTGRAVLADLAPHLTPAVMELSGNDAVFVLPGADLDLAARGIAFGLRLNGGATCIAPRRVFAIGGTAATLAERLGKLTSVMPAVVLSDRVAQQVSRLVDEARAAGAQLIGSPPNGNRLAPLVVALSSPTLGLCREDVFAPILSILAVANEADALAAAKQCSYALGASIFGPERAARDFAKRVEAGSITINDMIAPTADPRLPFGGRRASGFGATRGAAGLLEFTMAQTVSCRAGRFRPHYDPPGPAQSALSAAFLNAAHGHGPTARLRGWVRLLAMLARYKPDG